jgi:hypothetical protein
VYCVSCRIPLWVAVVSLPEAGRMSAVVVNTVIFGCWGDGEGLWAAMRRVDGN